jgi:hypothetical protein
MLLSKTVKTDLFSKDQAPVFKPYRPQAFFCRMEEKVHARYNVWIKLRTGSDETYRKLIREGSAH